MSGASSWRRLERRLADQGWLVELTSKGHWRCRPPDAAQPIVHVSESDDPRAHRNAIRDLRRSGYRDESDDEDLPVEGEELKAVEEPTANASEGCAGDDAPPPPSPPPPSIDDIFAALKAARDDYELARLAVEEAVAARLLAIRAVEAAQAECRARADAFAVARQAFDAALAVPIVVRKDPA